MQGPYSPPQADLTTAATAAGVHEVRVPGVRGVVTVQQQSVWTGAKLFLDGREMKRSWGKYALPCETGGSVTARLQDMGTGLVLRVGDQKIPVGPQISGALAVLAFLPFVCAGLGGAIGGAFGGLGWAANRAIAHSKLSAPIKALAMIGVVVLAFLATLLVAGVVHQAIVKEPG